MLKIKSLVSAVVVIFALALAGFSSNDSAAKTVNGVYIGAITDVMHLEMELKKRQLFIITG